MIHPRPTILVQRWSLRAQRILLRVCCFQRFVDDG
jgi:hypothetical protein